MAQFLENLVVSWSIKGTLRDLPSPSSCSPTRKQQDIDRELTRFLHTLAFFSLPPPVSAMASRSALIALLVAVSCAAAASAASFNVGDAQGWTLSGVNYDSWASGKKFASGDNLVFIWRGQHDVLEVSKSDYDACSNSNPTNTISTSPATVNLTSGPHYYICGISGHCSSGMKLAVTVDNGSGSPSTPSTPSTPPTPGAPSTPTTPSTPPPAGASVRLQAGPALAVAAAVLVKLAMF